MATLKLPNGRTIEYQLTRKRVKNVNIRIKEDGIVYVSANARVSVKRIEEILAERADFISKAVNQLKTREQRSKITAEKMRWLGKEYPVRVLRNMSGRVALEQDEIRVYTAHSNLAEEMLKQWANEHFAQLIEELNHEVCGVLRQNGLEPPPTRISIKDMKTRWGSCSYTRGHISINSRLMAYPRETVLSVLWHEYAHYWHHDHSAQFYGFLECYFPDYRKWNSLLK